MGRFFEIWEGLVYKRCVDYIKHTFRMIIKKRSLRFEECACGEYVFKFTEYLVSVLCRLVEFLTAEKMKYESHNVLW